MLSMQSPRPPRKRLPTTIGTEFPLQVVPPPVLHPRAANDNVPLKERVSKKSESERAAVEAAKEVLAARRAIGLGWDGRRVFAWPTAERLLHHERLDDLRLLYAWRNFADLALLEPANDNWRTPAPLPGEVDSRAAEEIIDLPDCHIGVRPTVGELWRSSSWADENSPQTPESVWSKWSDAEKRAKVTYPPGRRLPWKVSYELGGLQFGAGLDLQRFKTSPEQGWPEAKKSFEARIRPKSQGQADLELVSPAMSWTIDTRISAKSEFDRLEAIIGGDAVKVLELASGPSTARAIGEEFGKHGKTAERHGIRLVDAALVAAAPHRESLKLD